MKIRLFLASLVALSAVFLFSGQSAQADNSKFAATYDVTYLIDISGSTLITQHVSLKNLTANFYATQYSLSIGATHIKNVIATDSSGSVIPTTLNATTDSTQINLTFNQKVVGLSQVMTFQIRYNSDDIAVKNGFVWEVTIPKLASPDSIDAYNLDLKTPKNIGNVSSISPQPIRSTSDGDYNVFSFNKDQLVQSGINASFGDHQVFNFNLKYHLQNNQFFPVFQTIALPPDTENQTIVYSKLNPLPADITVDTDGNYIAKYRLNGNQKLDITLSGQVKIWNQSNNPPSSDWAHQDLSKYTVSDKYWETTFPQIAQKAKELKTPQAIYNYVTNTLKYDYARAAGNLVRLGAATAINNPTQAVCMEYTDLFIALSRAAGIPARELDGYAYTTNSHLKPLSFTSDNSSKSDILHAWAEYWNADQKKWIQVDPTWGSTTGGVDYFNKLDMNHVVFVVKGLSSINPAPAGSYKTDPKSQTSDVDVSLAPTEQDTTTGANLNIDFGSTIAAGWPFSGNITVSNSGNSTIFNSSLGIESPGLTFSNIKVGPIPPLSTLNFPVNGRTTNFNANSNEKINVTLTGVDAKKVAVTVTSTKSVQIVPLWQAAIPWLATLLVGLGLLVLAIRFRTRLVELLPKQLRAILKG